MSSDENSSLAALIQRLRRQLWRQRIRRGTALGIVVSALVLALAGATHLWLVPVSIGLWLPLGLLFPLLGAVYALLWQRPDSSRATALFDRHGDFGELLVSAGEAYSTPEHKRSAGAAAVLREAARRVPAIVVPPDWASKEGGLVWHSSYTALTWVVMLAGVFLLQLPGQTAGNGVAAVQATGSRDTGTESRLASPGGFDATRASSGQSASGPGMTPGGQVTDLQSVALQPEQEPPPSALALDQKTAERMIEAATGNKEEQTPNAPTGLVNGEDNIQAGSSGIAAGTSAGNPGAAASETTGAGPGDEHFELQLRYAEIARQISGQVTQTISGRDSVAFGQGDVLLSDSGPGGALGLEALAVPYAARFSPSQRLQINTYFETLEALP